jgi:hypothetical protein
MKILSQPATPASDDRFRTANNNSEITTAETVDTVDIRDWPDRISATYYQAGDLALELEAAARTDPYAPPTADQIEGYNRILADARALVPRSKALQEDVEEVLPEEATSVGEASEAPTLTVDALFRALNITIVPTLHNALTDIRPDAV